MNIVFFLILEHAANGLQVLLQCDLVRLTNIFLRVRLVRNKITVNILLYIYYCFVLRNRLVKQCY